MQSVIRQVINTDVFVFVAIAYALSVGLSSVIGLTGGHKSPLLALGLGTMFIPAIAVAAVMKTGPLFAALLALLVF